MAKLGRYSAQIKKTGTISAAKEVEEAEGGTVFTINGGGYNITLPKLSEIPTGWWCEFAVGTSGSANVNVLVDNDDASSLYGLITCISASGQFIPGSTNTAYFLAHSTAAFAYEFNTGQFDGNFTQFEVTKTSATAWRALATCFTPGFITGSN